MIARYSESLDWMGDIPGDFDVTIYNKGAEIRSAPALKRADRIVALADSGRKSDTILRHILNKTGFGDGLAVFLQGDPFEHSPDITALLSQWRHWHGVQLLAWRWIASEGLPPTNIMSRKTSAFIGAARVRPELFFQGNWNPLQFFDPGAGRIACWYLQSPGLRGGVSIATHSLRRSRPTPCLARTSRRSARDVDPAALLPW